MTRGGAFYTCTVAVFLFILNALPVFADDNKPGTPAPSIPNIDVMAARMKNYQDTYRQIRDDSLAAFVKAHPNVPVNDEIKAFMGITAYLWVWDDFYGEGLWSQGSRMAEHIMSKAIPEWQANMFFQENRLDSFHSSADGDAQYINFAALKLVETDYPFELKMQGCATALGNLVNYKTESNGDPNGNSFKSVPYLLKAWGDGYHQMIKGKFSHEQIDDAGANLLCVCQNDEKMLNLAIAQIDEVFNETDSSNPVKLDLDGQYFVDAAWCARGSSWASSVTDEGWQHFKERLAKANDILETAYAKYPAEGEIARSMINVELGQGQGRDRMEMWFQRATKANPDDYAAYKCKEWYLQPRWYGSVEDIVSFGKECVKTGNWAARIPMIFPTSIAEASDQDSTLYSRDDIWQPLEEVYREYLSHYPDSVNYRTWFAKHAADGGHLDVAREQLKILGSNWDHAVLSESDYADLIAKINSK
jgi:hypothetical protein